jgi:DNA-binding GntR family transcriptional regulator
LDPKFWFLDPLAAHTGRIMPTHNLEIKSLEQRAYELIKEMILIGELRPNDHLTEEKMANDLGVSRTTIQKAFIRLKNEYLLVGKPFKGVQVTSTTMDEALEAYDIRELLEGHGSRIAARRMNRKNILEMIRGFEELRSGDHESEGSEFQKLNFSFHMMLANSYRNKAVAKLMTSLIMKSKVYHQIHEIKYFYAEGSLEEHLDVLHAINNGDEDKAEMYTRKHIRTVKKAFVKIIKEKNRWKSQQTAI